MPDVTWQTLAEQRGGDHDEMYVWGRPREYLSLVQQGRLTILRGYCMDTKRGGEARNCATGDMAYTETPDNGLIVPLPTQGHQ